MFDINNIQYNQASGQYTCCCQCNSSQDADYLCAKYTMLPKQFDIVGEIYSRGSTAIIGTSNPKAATAIASCINANYFMPPLDVYIFYGSSQKDLPSRWCVGLDITNASQLINLLNRQDPLINADNSPQNWFDKMVHHIPLLCLPEYWNKGNLKNLKKELISASLQFRMLPPESSLFTLYNSCPQSAVN